MEPARNTSAIHPSSAAPAFQVATLIPQHAISGLMAENRRAIIVVSSVAAVTLLLWGYSLVPPSYLSLPSGRAPGQWMRLPSTGRLALRFFRWPGVPLRAGETLTPADPIAVSYRNLGNESLWAMVFAYDATGELHWLYPHHTPGTRTDDISVQLVKSSAERNLDANVARLGDLPPGPLTVFALVTPGIMVTSRIERLLPSEQNRQSLLERFPDAVVVELQLIAAPTRP
jgi:hypothetical protein